MGRRVRTGTMCAGAAALIAAVSLPSIGQAAEWGSGYVFAGVANGTYIFVLPGSTGAVKLAWEKLICHQLDYRTRPCNLVEMMPRLAVTAAFQGLLLACTIDQNPPQRSRRCTVKVAPMIPLGFVVSYQPHIGLVYQCGWLQGVTSRFAA